MVFLLNVLSNEKLTRIFENKICDIPGIHKVSLQYEFLCEFSVFLSTRIVSRIFYIQMIFLGPGYEIF